VLQPASGRAARFIHDGLPMRVRFGSGSLAELPDEVDALGLDRVLVLCSPEQKSTGQQVATILGDRCAGVLAEARMHVPAASARRAREIAAQAGASGCLAVGGGSAVGLGKAIALTTDLPIVAVPTTYAGSEMTPVWGLTENGVKRTGRDRRVLPRSVVYDPELTLTLPVGLSLVSGFNAVAHAVEGLYAPDSTPITDMMATEGLFTLLRALPRLVADGHDLDARADALRGSWFCGAVLGATTMSLHHKLCHALGGMLNLPHAPTHTVVLPHVLAANAPAAPQAAAAIAEALGGAGDSAVALWELAGQLGAPLTLRELGMRHEDIARVADEVVEHAYANPVPLERAAVEFVLDQAWSGAKPSFL
jgi:maleylacetate reductase